MCVLYLYHHAVMYVHEVHTYTQQQALMCKEKQGKKECMKRHQFLDKEWQEYRLLTDMLSYHFDEV